VLRRTSRNRGTRDTVRPRSLWSSSCGDRDDTEASSSPSTPPLGCLHSRSRGASPVLPTRAHIRLGQRPHGRGLCLAVMHESSCSGTSSSETGALTLRVAADDARREPRVTELRVRDVVLAAQVPADRVRRDLGRVRISGGHVAHGHVPTDGVADHAEPTARPAADVEVPADRAVLDREVQPGSSRSAAAARVDVSLTRQRSPPGAGFYASSRAFTTAPFTLRHESMSRRTGH